jgi:hypothetical protein
VAARSVEREHELRDEPLAIRILADQRLKLADERRMPAESERGLEALLEHAQAELLEPLGVRATG